MAESSEVVMIDVDAADAQSTPLKPAAPTLGGELHTHAQTPDPTHTPQEGTPATPADAGLAVDAGTPAGAALTCEPSAAAASTPAGKPASGTKAPPPPLSDPVVLRTIFALVHGRPARAFATTAKDAATAMKAAGTLTTTPSAAAVERTLKAYCTKAEVELPADESSADSKARKPSKVCVWSVIPGGWAAAGVVEAPALTVLPEFPRPEPAASAQTATAQHNSTTPEKSSDPAAVVASPDAVVVEMDPVPVEVAASPSVAAAANHAVAAPQPAYVPTDVRIEPLRKLLTTLADTAASHGGTALHATLGVLHSAEPTQTALAAFGAFWAANCVPLMTVQIDPVAGGPAWMDVWSPVVVLLAHTSSAPLATLASNIASALQRASALPDEGDAQLRHLTTAVDARLRVLMQRKPHGVRPTGCIAYEDVTPTAIWRWECSDFDGKLAPMVAAEEQGAAPADESNADAAHEVATSTVPAPVPASVRVLSTKDVRELARTSREYMHHISLLGKRLLAASTLLDLLLAGPSAPKKKKTADGEKDDPKAVWLQRVQTAQERLDETTRKLVEEEEAAAKRAAKRAEEAAVKEAERAARAAERAVREAEKAEAKEKERVEREARAKEKAAAKEAKLTAGSAKLTAFFGVKKSAPAAAPAPAAAAPRASPQQQAPSLVEAVGAAQVVEIAAPVVTAEAVVAVSSSCTASITPIATASPHRFVSLLSHPDVTLVRALVAQRGIAARRAAEARYATPATIDALDSALHLGAHKCAGASSNAAFKVVSDDWQSWLQSRRRERAEAVSALRTQRRRLRELVLADLKSNAVAQTLRAAPVRAAGAAAAFIDLSDEPVMVDDCELEKQPAFSCAKRGLIRGISRMKLLSFHVDTRPAYFGTWDADRAQRRRARATGAAAAGADEDDERYGVRGDTQGEDDTQPKEPYISTAGKRKLTRRNPFGVDAGLFDYEEDSEAEWEEEAGDDVTDLEAASAGEPDEDDDSEAGKDDGRADAAQYNYEDDWLAHDDEIEYDEAAGAAGARANAEEYIDLDGEPAGAATTVAARTAGVAAHRPDASAAAPVASYTTARLLHDPGMCFFASFFGGSTTVPFAERESTLAAQTAIGAAAARAGAAEDVDHLRGARLRAWAAEITAMATHALVPEPLVLRAPPAGGPEDSLVEDGLRGAAAAPDVPAGRGGAKRPVPEALIPLLARLMHGSALAVEKIRAKWRELAPAVLAQSGDGAMTLAAAQEIVCNVSNRQLELLCAELGFRGKAALMDKSADVGGTGQTDAAPTQAPAADAPTAGDAATDAGAACSATAPSASVGPRIEAIPIETYIAATLANEGVDAAEGAFRKVRWFVREEVAASMNAAVVIPQDVGAATQTIVAYMTAHQLSHIPTLAATAAPPPAAAGKKRRRVAAEAAVKVGPLSPQQRADADDPAPASSAARKQARTVPVPAAGGVSLLKFLQPSAVPATGSEPALASHSDVGPVVIE